jgi:hypothetical protein
LIFPILTTSISSHRCSGSTPGPQLRQTHSVSHIRQDEFEALASRADISSAEAEFVKIALAYSNRRHISYATWREIGVEAAVLKKAGVPRSL